MSASKPTFSIAARVTLYFARNHDDDLTTVDITVKFDVPLPQVHKALTPLVRDGVLERVSIGSGRGRHTLYKAGPALLRTIGVERAESNVPTLTANLAAA